MAGTDKELKSLLGGGGKSKIPWQVKLGILGVIELVLWGATLDLSLWLTLSILFLVIGWVCFMDIGNILLTIGVLIFATLLVGTRLGDPMKQISNGVKAIGDEGVGSVGDLNIKLPERTPSSPITTAPTTTTSIP